MRKKIIGFSVILFSLFCLTDFLYASDKAFDPLYGIKQAEPSNWDLNEPIWESGKIDYISPGNLVVSDTEYFFSPKIKFYSEDGNLISKKRFKNGKKVKFVLSSERRSIITKLILMD